MLESKVVSPQIIGIANTVEIFKGEFSNQSKTEKIIFEPYTKQDIIFIMINLMKHEIEQIKFFDRHFKKNSKKVISLDIVNKFVEIKAFELAASKIDKLSGDLRVSFEIMRFSI